MKNTLQARKKPLTIAIAILAVIVGIFILRAILSSSKTQRNPVQTVRTALSEQKTFPVTVRANGYVTSIQTVEVRPQIQNIVRAIHVKEGQDVVAGQLLFTLDDRSDAAGVDKAKGQLARDRADLIDAEATLKRNQELFAKKFISQAVVDTSKAKVDALRGTARTNQAGVQSSQVALGYNRIAASIAGRIGAISVHPGSLVQPTGAAMVTIAQLDPIHVSFTVPEAELAHIAASYPNGGAPVSIRLPDNTDLQGTLVFIDNATDPQTGTLKMKAQFDNPQRRLWPGSFVNVQLVSRTLPDAVVVPTQAVVTGPKEQFVYIVQEDGTVQPQNVKLLATEGGTAAVSGLAAGVRVVVEGAQNLRPGSLVREAPAPEQPARHEP
ncbi:MAG: efflux RND transporter periplasmic adaptor subunit [Burkholderiaceae bacterium]|nr:efflux RND transporter periplasmic adaptor subunit [Burkholderiaceae bacterium]